MVAKRRKRELIHLDAAVVSAIHAEVLAAHGGGPGVRDRALLESAVAAPRASHAGKPLIADPIDVAAAYLYNISRSHPFVDGNKRTALAACLVFLQINGFLPDRGAPTRAIDNWEALAWDVAASRIGREQTANRLRTLLRAAPRKTSRRNRR